jgi:hypothetical protein
MKKFYHCLFIALININTTISWFPSYYPEYCAKDMKSRFIPPLTDDQYSQVDQLLQVQVVNRHGARTPYASFSCWKNYSIVWNNCNVSELMFESPNLFSTKLSSKWMFRKIYDGSANYFGGNCHTGQLLPEGFNQEQKLGEIISNAYFKGKLKLFPTDIWTDLDTNNYVYLRSDDSERTLMSGQILVHSLFNV